MAPARQKRCLLVLGMHNSGTSLLSNLMHGAGVPLGPNLLLRDRMPEKRRAPYDYYEDAEIVRLQDATLLDLQRHWSSYRAAWPLPPAYHPSRELFRQNLQRLIPERLGPNSLWLVKDPRSAILIEDWLLVLRQLNVQPRLLLVHRDPASNIRSFSRKGKVPPLWAEALWQRTYQQAILAIHTLPKESWANTRFETLLQQPKESVMELCEWLQHPINARHSDQLAARVDQALPAFPPAPGSDQNDEDLFMHPATRALQEQLELKSSCTPPHALLADDLQEATADCTTALELNRVRSDAQTLLPKASVTIISNELRGWGPWGGIDFGSRTLSAALVSAGHPVTLLLISEPTQAEVPELPGIWVHLLQSSSCSHQELLDLVVSWLREHPCDVVHLHDCPGLAGGLRKALQPHPPQLIVGLRKERTLELDDLQQADWLISPTQSVASWAEQHLLDGQRPKNLIVNRSCPPPEQLEATNQTTSATAAPQIDCVYFGRLDKSEALAKFLQALLKIKHPPKQVLFLGNDSVHQRRTSSEEILAMQLVHDQLRGSGIAVLHKPWRSNEGLAQLIRLEAVVVIPSLFEHSPNVVEELRDSGLPMVMVNESDTKARIKQGNQASLTSKRLERLADHLRQALTAPGITSRIDRPKSDLDTWRIHLSWQAFHERLPRRADVDGEDMTTAAVGASTTSPWRQLIRRLGRKAGQVGQNLLEIVKK